MQSTTRAVMQLARVLCYIARSLGVSWKGQWRQRIGEVVAVLSRYHRGEHDVLSLCHQKAADRCLLLNVLFV